MQHCFANPHDTQPPYGQACRAKRERGMAMVLVVIALAVATMLAVPFLAAQSTSIAVGQNIVHHSRAQAVAESGLELALAYIYQNPDWRETQQTGQWLNDFAFADGLVTVSVVNEDDALDTLDGAVIVVSTGYFNSVSHTVRARVDGSIEMAGNTDLLPYGMAVAERVDLIGNVTVDALDSRQDMYSPWGAGRAEAVIATNTTASGQVNIQGSSQLKGDLLVGPAGNPNQVLTTQGNVTVSGEMSSLAEPMGLPTVTLPTPLPPSQGNASFPTWGTHILSEGVYRYDNFQLGGSTILQVEGDVTLVADDLFRLGASGQLLLQPGATLTVYADRLQFDGNSRLKHISGYDPTAIRIHQTGDSDVVLTGSSHVAAGIIAPHAELDMSGNPRLFGAFQGQHARLQGSARFTQDQALLENSGGGSGVGGNGSDGGGYTVRWLSTE